MTHPSIEILIQHALGLTAAADETEHIAACARCGEEVRGLLESPQQVAVLEGPPPELGDLQSAIDDEREHAAARLAQVEGDSMAEAVESEPVFHSFGGFRVVLERVPSIRRRDPALSLRLCRALVGIAERFVDQLLRDEAKVDALREAATSHRVLGNYPDALKLLDEAEAATEHLVVPDHAVARIWYERASLEIHRGGSAAARVWAERAAEAFHRFGDRLRWNRSRFLIASSHYNERNFREAVVVARELLSRGETQEDLQILATSWSLIGHSLTREDRVESAREAFSRAIDLFSTLNQPIDRLRAEWGKARTLIRLGELQPALRELERIRSEFRQLDLLEETSLIGLDVTECLVEAGEMKRARSVCRDSLRVLQELFSGREQQRALAYLAEISSSSLNAAAVRHVSGFLADSIADPGTSFVPLST